MPALAMATAVALTYPSRGALPMPAGQATLLRLLFRWGHLPPTPVQGRCSRAAHAGGVAARHGCVRVLGYLAADASAHGWALRCCAARPPRLLGRCCGALQSCAAAVPDVAGDESESDADGILSGGAAQRRMQAFRERVCGRAVMVEDIASLYDYPLDDFQVQQLSAHDE